MKMQLSWRPVTFTPTSFTMMIDFKPGNNRIEVEVKNRTEAQAALEKYKESVTEDGHVFAHVPRGQRKFAGFDDWNSNTENFHVRRGVTADVTPA